MPRRIAMLFIFLALALPGLCARAGETVALQLKWLHAYQFAGYYVARELGYYREAGLEVEIREGYPGVDFVKEVVSGRAQYGTGSSGLILDRNQGAPVVALAVIFQHSPDILMVPELLRVTSPQQLVSKRVMTSYSTPAIAAMLSSEAGALDKFHLLDQTNDLDGLIAGRLDALAGYSTDQPFYYQSLGFPVTLLRPIQYGVDFYGDNLFTSESELRDHPARAKAFRAASLRGWEYAMAHPEETIAIIKRYGSARAAEHLLYEYQAMRDLILPELVELGHMNPGRWRHIADTYAGLGQLLNDYSLEGFLYDPDPAIGLEKFRRYLWAWITGMALAMLSIALLSLLIRRLRREVRERAQAEQSLRRSEQRLSEAQHLARTGSWEWSLATGQGV